MIKKIMKKDTFSQHFERISDIFLVGCPNCGKTTLFNSLTGSELKTGNYSGVTVEAKSGKLRNSSLTVTDLPGIHSLSPSSDDERAAVDALCGSNDCVIVNVADANDLSRSMRLTTELLSLGKPTVMAVNMNDELDRRHGRIDFERLSELLGIPAFPIEALKKKGLERLINEISAPSVPKKPYLSADEITNEVWIPPQKVQSLADSILMGKYTALPCFVLIMALIFYVVFGDIGRFLSGFVRHAVGTLSLSASSLCRSLGFPEFLTVLFAEGLLAGVGEALAFLPPVILLFVFMSLLEDTGYIARIAYITDRLFGFFGLSGKVMVPVITGFGCTFPAIMACRALGTKKEKALASVFIPFLSCSAKIPVYSALCLAFFPRHAFAVITLLYLAGIFTGLCFVLIFKGKERNFSALEIPPYRLPSVYSVLRLIKRKCRELMGRVFSSVLLSSAAVWFLSTHGTSFSLCEPENSLLALLGNMLSPLFAPLGFGSWQASAAVISGFSAKEAIVSTLYLTSGGISEVFTPASAMSFMVFTLLGIPCVSSLKCIKEENGTSFAVTTVLRHFAVAYAAAAIVYRCA